MNLQKMNKELLEEVNYLKNQNILLYHKNKELTKQLRLGYGVGSLPCKEEMEVALASLMKHKKDSFKTEYDKITFKFGFRTCFSWLENKFKK